MKQELINYPDKAFVNYLCSSLENGFETLVSDCKNLLSATQEPGVVDELIIKECKKCFLLGPYHSPPFDIYSISPICVATGKYSNKKRLIVDLSAPHDNQQHQSINDIIPYN